MIPAKRLFATLALALAFMAGAAQAERAVLYGCLLVISDQFVVKTSQPFETEIEDEDGALVHYRENKIQVAGYGPEDVASLRALVGKKSRWRGKYLPPTRVITLNRYCLILAKAISCD